MKRIIDPLLFRLCIIARYTTFFGWVAVLYCASIFSAFFYRFTELPKNDYEVVITWTFRASIGFGLLYMMYSFLEDIPIPFKTKYSSKDSKLDSVLSTYIACAIAICVGCTLFTLLSLKFTVGILLIIGIFSIILMMCTVVPLMLTAYAEKYTLRYHSYKKVSQLIS